MRAVISERYGSPDVCEIRQVPKLEPEAGEVLIRVRATTVSRTDDGMLRPHPFFARLFTGLIRPKCTILGLDFAGEIEAVGKNVKAFKPGDRVFGLSPETYGAHADYICLPETGAIALMPPDARFGEVVVCEGAWYASMYLKNFALEPGHKILIYGASGAIGTAAVQLAKFYGAEVTAVTGTRQLALVESLGADHVVDYSTADFTRIAETFDFVLDAVGKTTYFQCRRLLKTGGVFAATDLGPGCQNVFLAIWSGMTGSNKVIFPTPKNSKAAVDLVKTCIEAGQFRAVVDRRYALEEIVDAYRYVETAQKTGIVVIDVAPEDESERQRPRL